MESSGSSSARRAVNTTGIADRDEDAIDPESNAKPGWRLFSIEYNAQILRGADQLAGDPGGKNARRLTRENERLHKRAAQADAFVKIHEQVAAFLGIAPKRHGTDESEVVSAGSATGRQWFCVRLTTRSGESWTVVYRRGGADADIGRERSRLERGLVPAARESRADVLANNRLSDRLPVRIADRLLDEAPCSCSQRTMHLRSESECVQPFTFEQNRRELWRIHLRAELLS